MSISSPYFRTFTAGAVWFSAVAIKMVSRHPGHWTTYPPRNLIVLVVAWIVTGLLLGVAGTRFQKLRSWVGIGLGTVVGSLGILALMLFTVERVYGPPAPPKFKNTDEMMAYFATQAAQWVKKDRDIDLDYSLDSIRVIERELERTSSEINKTNPQQGTFGLAIGYGAYVGEVLRRRNGGFWAVDHPAAGAHSYPLTIRTNNTIFPVGWCWKRLTVGEEDNVYNKAVMVEEVRGTVINNTEAK